VIVKQDIGSRIFSIRKDRKLNQDEFAKSIGITQQALSLIEKGSSLPSLEVLQKITSIYCISYSDILDENCPPLTDKIAPHSAPHSKNNAVHSVVKGSPKILDVQEKDMEGSSGIPYYEMLPVSAGDITAFLKEAKPTSHINLPQISDCQAVLPVYGSSMKGVVEQGDLIAVQELHSRNEYDPTVPYLVITEEHRMIKYLRMDATNEEIIWATSTNHEPIKLSAGNIKMVYAIKCVIRFF